VFEQGAQQKEAAAMKFDEAVGAFRDGRMTSTEFFRVTQSAWQRMARYLLRRWRAPAWVEQEEIVQELHLGAMLCIWCYSDCLARGRTLAEYVEWNAIDYAKKKLHAMRGANRSGNADANPSHFEKPFSAFAPHAPAFEFRVEPDQERQFEIKQAIERACTTVRERYALDAFLREGDIVTGAIALFADARMRRLCGLNRPRDAGRLVANAAFALAQQLAAA
jgi:hypothetical protein